MTVRVVGKCRKCGKVCARGLTRCKAHPIGRPRKARPVAQLKQVRTLAPQTWTKAQVALDDDVYAQLWEAQQRVAAVSGGGVTG